MAFEVMDNYGCSRNIVALNSLLSAICRDGRPVDACDYLQVRVNNTLVRESCGLVELVLETKKMLTESLDCQISLRA